MKLIRGLHNLHEFNTNLSLGCVLTVGNFDGVHFGHKKIIQNLNKKASLMNIPSMVMLFEPHPIEYFNADKAPVRLMNLREKLQCLQELKVNYVLLCRFNDNFAKLEATKFIKEILVSKIKIKHIIIGDDFKFGKRRKGDFNLLKKAGIEYNFSVYVTPTFSSENARVSSTSIRQALSGNPDLPKAARLLDREFFFSGRIVHGKKLGRTLGFPTLNLNPKRLKMPLSGVFAVSVHGLADKPCNGVANIGVKPTVNGSIPSVEVHLLDWNKLVYGANVKVILHKIIRAEIKFDSLEALITQIKKDVIEVKYYFNNYINVNKND